MWRQAVADATRSVRGRYSVACLCSHCSRDTPAGGPGSGSLPDPAPAPAAERVGRAASSSAEDTWTHTHTHTRLNESMSMNADPMHVCVRFYAGYAP